MITFIAYTDYHQGFFKNIRLISSLKFNTLKKIIHATDFSENASKALEFAIDLSKKFNAELILLHIGDIPKKITTNSSFTELAEIEINSLIRRLKDYAGNYPDTTNADFKIRFIAKLNSSPTVGILDTIDESDADLVVVGTKGQDRIKEIVVGSTTKFLVETAPCPVLAIPKDTVFREIQKIVYASDFDPNDIPAIKRIIPISQVYHAKIAVLHLFENEVKEQPDAIAFQQQLTAEVDYVHLKYDTEASHNIARSLVNYLQLKQADLLVMFEKENTGISGLFKKSTVKQFVDHALTIPFMSYNIHSMKSSIKE